MRRLFPRLFPRILLGPRPFSRPAQFSIFAAVILLFLFSQTSFGPSSEVHGALKTIMGLSRAQMDILIKTTSDVWVQVAAWPLRASLPNRHKAVSELKRPLRGRFGSNAHEKVSFLAELRTTYLL